MREIQGICGNCGGTRGFPRFPAGNALSGEVDDNVGGYEVYRGQEMPGFQDFKRYCEQTGRKKFPRNFSYGVQAQNFRLIFKTKIIDFQRSAVFRYNSDGLMRQAVRNLSINF